MANDTPGVILPEIILYKAINSILNIIKSDYDDSTDPDKKDTMLFCFFGKDEEGNDLSIEQFNYFKQSIATFIDKTPSVNIGYNLEVALLGSIHILLPMETGQPLNLGASENYMPYIQTDDSFKPVYTQTFDTTYNLLITSENSFEAILIYNLLKCSFLALNSHLELAGLRLPKTSGNDLNIQSNLVPTHIFHRSLLINFLYELNVPDFFFRKLVKKFKITGIMY